MNTPRLVSQWMPTPQLGAEALRERAASSALPPLYFLHVWWSRKPLILARAAVLAALLPAWTESNLRPPPSDIQALLNSTFGSEAEYRRWFLEAIGIKGDPVVARQLIVKAVQSGNRIKNPYGYNRAFTSNPLPEHRQLLEIITNFQQDTSAGNQLVVLDPFGGGGSIPFEAARYGCHGLTTELNPVATAVLHGTVDLPFRLGEDFPEILSRWGENWCQLIKDRLARFFHRTDEQRLACVWALTVPCPTTGHPTPLLPNHWLARTAQQKVAIKLYPDSETGEISVELLDNATAAEGNLFTYRRGAGTSVFTGDTFDGKYIAAEARAGRMGMFLRAIAYRPANGRGTQFRVPVEEDFVVLEEAERFLRSKWDEWDAKGLIPTELIPMV